MCVGDKNYCKKLTKMNLYGASISRTNDLREHHLNLAAAWMVMYASAL